MAASLRFGEPGQKLMLFDCKSQRWEDLATVQAHYPEWSHDREYIYFDSLYEKVPAIFRVRISDRKVEQVVELKEFLPAITAQGPWMGLAPDDSILLTRGVGSQEVYALDWQVP